MAKKKKQYQKTSEAIKRMRQGGIYLGQVKDILYALVKPGISLEELDLVASKEIKKRNCEVAFYNYLGFPKNICISVNEILIHGIPNHYRLREGDLVSLDLGLIYQGYYLDSAFTKSVGAFNQENEKLINIAENAFSAGMQAITKGATINDISKAIGNYIEKHHFFTPENFSGHGIGKELHQRPYIFNYERANQDSQTLITNGMVFCVEPMILQASKEVEILKDGWSVRARSGLKSSHYEETILIENYRPVILTKGNYVRKRY